MKYLFKNKEELSKKERKRKRRGWADTPIAESEADFNASRPPE
jgi:hypothetical protein